MRPLNFGIIGAGGISRIMHLPEIKALGPSKARVVLIQGRKESRLHRLCAEFDVPHWTHSEDLLLSDPRIDAVIVATPHPLHVGPGIKAIRAGKHLFMQKPLCASMAEADAFVREASRTKKTVMVLPHFAPAIVGARALIGMKAIGLPSAAYARTSHGGPEVYYKQVSDALGERFDPKDKKSLWFFDKKKADVGALFDMGVYAVSFLVAMLGSVKRVTGIVRTLDKPTPLEDTATLILEFASGIYGTAETGWTDPVRTWQFRIHGTRGNLTFGFGDPGLTRWIPGSYTREGVPPKKVPVGLKAFDHGSAHAHFLACVHKGTNPPLSHGRAARHVTEILLAGLRSAKSEKPVRILSKAE